MGQRIVKLVDPRIASSAVVLLIGFSDQHASTNARAPRALHP